MANIFPSIDIIVNMNPKPTEGELYLLNFLNENLDNSYEIYFQPLLNGDNPDIVLVKKDCGVLIIEVKDWKLKYYHSNEKGDFILNKNNCIIKSPFDQAKQYKDNIYSLHVPELLNKKIETPYAYGVVSCGVYFHNETEDSVKNFLGEVYMKNKEYKYHEIIGRDTLNRESFLKLLNRRHLIKKSRYFDYEIYKTLKRYFQPSEHKYEDGKNIKYTKKQEQLIKSKIGEQKIKGVAGSGKTLILAKRAVNALKRTNGRILILTYNITLKNYIHDRISEVRENFKWESFHINNYHNFIMCQLNNLGVVVRVPQGLKEDEKTEYLETKYYSNENLFKKIKDKIGKYDAVFIDETQDYKKVWMDIIKNYFLKSNGEYVIFGDEKQNVYKRELETDRKPKTNIRGNWNILDESFRLPSNIADLALSFQKRFFKEKYDIDHMKVIQIQQSFFQKKQYIDYVNFKCNNYEKIARTVHGILENMHIHPNDSCIIASKIAILREIEYAVRKIFKEETEVNFERKEEYEKLKNENRLEMLQEVRHSRKCNFWMNRGVMKFCTVHSFKGWEINTAFLIIDNATNLTDEIIYTGMTRSMENLIIINLNNEKYNSFFKNVSDTNIENFIPNKLISI